MREGGRVAAAALLALAFAPACYLTHMRGEDGGARIDAGRTRCGSESCALVPASRHLAITTSGLVGRVEAQVSGLREVPEIDGVAFELDPCAATGRTPCPSTITVANAGGDLAGPGVLAGSVECSIRDRMIVVRSDPCPGCDDGHEPGRLLFAAGLGELSDFDLLLADVVVEDAGEVCSSRGTIGESSGRHRVSFASVAPRVEASLDEGETARLGLSDYAARLVRSSYECVSPDLPPPRPLEVAEWVIWIEGPR